MSPAHSRGQGRWLVVGLVVVVLVAMAVVSRHSGPPATSGPPAAPAALVTAPDAESSAWYCIGPTTASGQLALGATVFSNTNAQPVVGTVNLTTDTGAQVHFGVSIPPDGLVIPSPGQPSSGSWTAESINLSRGGVGVSQAVHGPNGWSETPCQSRTSSVWYFPSGSTSGSNGLFLALFDPTSTPVVVDLTFFTPSGPIKPINFQGVVLQSGGLAVANVSAYVLSQANVAIVATTRTGQIVATELEDFNGSSTGLGLVNGQPELGSQWSLPYSEEVPGGASSIGVLNPGTTTEKVTVHMRVATGALAPFTTSLRPDSIWTLSTSSQTRIPKDDPYSTVVTATGGPGVVVGRVVVAPSSSPSPQAGMVNAIDTLTTSWPSHQWLVLSPGTFNSPAVNGALPQALTLLNLSDQSEVLVVSVVTPSGFKGLTQVSVAAHTSRSIDGNFLLRVGLYPLVIRSTGPAAVSEDVGPAGAAGVITMPGIPIEADEK